jgi:hypothetical protein
MSAEIIHINPKNFKGKDRREMNNNNRLKEFVRTGEEQLSKNEIKRRKAEKIRKYKPAPTPYTPEERKRDREFTQQVLHPWMEKVDAEFTLKLEEAHKREDISLKERGLSRGDAALLAMSPDNTDYERDVWAIRMNDRASWLEEHLPEDRKCEHRGWVETAVRTYDDDVLEGRQLQEHGSLEKHNWFESEEYRVLKEEELQEAKKEI